MVPNPPTDMPRITPHLFYDDIATATDWLIKAFGFELKLRMTNKAGQVVHTELEVADSLFMLGWTAENENWVSPQEIGGRSTARLYVFVDDVDAHCERARAAGAKITREPADAFWGDRLYECVDLEGHIWKFAMHIFDVDNRNLKRPEDM